MTATHLTTASIERQTGITPDTFDETVRRLAADNRHENIETQLVTLINAIQSNHQRSLANLADELESALCVSLEHTIKQITNRERMTR